MDWDLSTWVCASIPRALYEEAIEAPRNLRPQMYSPLRRHYMHNHEVDSVINARGTTFSLVIGIAKGLNYDLRMHIFPRDAINALKLMYSCSCTKRSFQSLAVYLGGVKITVPWIRVQLHRRIY
jgi:hypothetical protein